jgi:hypothetical protein
MAPLRFRGRLRANAGKLGVRLRLLRLYRETGDEDYRRAAECLRPGLMEILEEKSKHPGRRGSTRERASIPRIDRMAVMIAVSIASNPYDAARREVRANGRGEHPSEAAAIDYLRTQFRKRREALPIAVDYLLRIEPDWRRLLQRLGGRIDNFGEILEQKPASIPPMTRP